MLRFRGCARHSVHLFLENAFTCQGCNLECIHHSVFCRGYGWRPTYWPAPRAGSYPSAVWKTVLKRRNPKGCQQVLERDHKRELEGFQACFKRLAALQKPCTGLDRSGLFKVPDFAELGGPSRWYLEK